MPQGAGRGMIGILGLQGDVIEHISGFSRIGVETKVIKLPCDLKEINGLVIPGGESTTITKLLVSSGLVRPINDMIKKGLPTWGTCAGVILLSKGGILENADVKVRRNAYGSQLDSFITRTRIHKIGRDVTMVFIRAPRILEVGTDVKVLAKVNGDIVAAQSANILLTTFHPELTEDTSIIKYFMKIVENSDLRQGYGFGHHMPGRIT